MDHIATMVSTALAAVERERGGTATRKRKRGRPRKTNTVFFQMFLLDRPMDKLPTPNHKRWLAEHRFGMPRDYSAGTFRRDWDVSEVWNHIISSFPDSHLALVWFVLKKASKAMKLTCLEFESVEELKKDVGKGKLYIVPKRQIQQSHNSDEDAMELPELVPLDQKERNVPVNPSDASDDLATHTDVPIATPNTESHDIAASDTGWTPTTPLTHGQESRVQRIAATAARETIRENALIIMSNEIDLPFIPPRSRARNRLSRRALQVETLNEIAHDGTSHVDAGTPTPSEASDDLATHTDVPIATPNTETLNEIAHDGTSHVDAGTPTPSEASDDLATHTDVPIATPNTETLNEIAHDGTSHVDAGTSTVQLRQVTGQDAVTPPLQGTSSSIVKNAGLEADLSAALLDLEKFISPEQGSLAVTRADIVAEMLQYYQDSSVLDCRLHVEFLGEPGDDFGGLMKEVFTLFWREATKTLFIGEHRVVPYLPLHLQRRDSWKFVSLGRILTHTIMLTGGMPPNLSRSFLIDLIFDCEVGEEYLLEDFLEYVTDRERKLLMKAITDYHALNQTEVERLTSLYTAYRFLDIPRELEMKDQVLAIAAQELIQKPSPLCKHIRKGIPACHLEGFWAQLSIDHITYILHKQRPTADKVVESLVPDVQYLSDVEETALYYLKEFISCMSEDLPVDFLLFCTGSIHQPERLKVSFTGLCGLQRRPIAHTCTYNSFQDFRREFTFLLGTTEAYQYSSV